jgi:hypothetical protein
MARLEWAHVVAFDGSADKVLGPQDLLELTPSLRAGVQPYISFLDLHYPVDELRVKLKTAPEHSATTSNVAVKKKTRVFAKIRTLKAEPIYLAVHRLDASVYYRRLAMEEFRLLGALRSGKTIANAIELAFRESSLAPPEIPDLLRKWFKVWAECGWLSARRQARRRS